MNAEWEQWDVQEKTAQANKRRIEAMMTNDELMKFNEASEPKSGPSKEPKSDKSSEEAYNWVRNNGEHFEMTSEINAFDAGVKFQKEIDAPKFKELVWEKTIDKTLIAEISFGVYHIFEYESLFTRGKKFMWQYSSSMAEECKSIEQAKQIAQKDYEEKCKSLLK